MAIWKKRKSLTIGSFRPEQVRAPASVHQAIEVGGTDPDRRGC